MDILLVEDNVTTAQIVRHLLRQLVDGTIGEAHNGSQALKELHGRRYDAVLLDWMMPGMSGIDVLRWIRKNPAHRFTPVLMMTAKDSQEDVLLAIESGADDYILKPISLITLQSKLDQLKKRIPSSRQTVPKS